MSSYEIKHKRPYEYYLGCIRGIEMFSNNVPLKEIDFKGYCTKYIKYSLEYWAYRLGCVNTYLDLKYNRKLPEE